MGKYNEQDNDEYLLQTNLLDIHSIEELQEDETLVFSQHAAELEHEDSRISFTLKGFKKLHHYLFQHTFSLFPDKNQYVS